VGGGWGWGGGGGGGGWGGGFLGVLGGGGFVLGGFFGGGVGWGVVGGGGGLELGGETCRIKTENYLSYQHYRESGFKNN